jgi:excinuclease UvrABC nuclease subunit
MRYFTPNEYFIYCMMGDNDEFLYIGKTGNLERRISQHKTDKHWFSEVRKIYYQLLKVDNYRSADYFEHDLMQVLRPKYNKQIHKTKKVKMPPIIPTRWTFADKHLIWLKNEEGKAKVYDLCESFSSMAPS